MTATRVRMTVDVSLCGSIPRSHMPHLPSLSRSVVTNSSCRSQTKTLPREPPSLPRCLSTVKPSAFSCTDADDEGCSSSSPVEDHHGDCKLTREKMISLAASSLQQQGNGCNWVQQEPQQGQPSSVAFIEPPSWAVPARGESRLEPVCEMAHRQSSVDLTTRSVFSVGRSPSSDIQLLHETSSRRHAMLFHHPNGSCYVADCGSVHGTYVNGVRITSLQPGRVVPHRLKRGAMVRFGGPGSPTYVLKSFSTGFESLARNVMGETVELKVLEEQQNETKGASDTPTLAPSKATRLMWMSSQSQQDASIASLVKLNTRMNALGGPSALTPSNLAVARKALNKISTSSDQDLQQLLQQCPSILKRSFDQLDQTSRPTESDTVKRRRLYSAETVTAPLNNNPQDDSILPIVSPTRTIKSLTSLDLDSPVTTTTTITADSTTTTNSSLITISPLTVVDSTPNPYGKICPCSIADRLCNLPPPPFMDDAIKRKKNKRVHFSDEKPLLFFPPSVTPDFSSDDEDDDTRISLKLNNGGSADNNKPCSSSNRVSLNILTPRTPRDLSTK